MPLGQTAFDAARKVRVFHLCQESHEVPEQVQHSCIDDDMILKSKGQTAYDATQEHRHWYGDGGDCGHGGKAGKDGFFGKGNVSLPLSDEEEDWETGCRDFLMKWGDKECRRIRDQEARRSQGDQESRGPGEYWAWKCECAGLGLLRVFSRVLKQLYVADWHKSSLYMCALATRFP